MAEDAIRCEIVQICIVGGNGDFSQHLVNFTLFPVPTMFLPDPYYVPTNPSVSHGIIPKRAISVPSSIRATPLNLISIPTSTPPKFAGS
jgi:hypothetical protein